MSGFETAIRGALERSDRADWQNRDRIYQSARRALDAGLRRKGISDPQVVARQHDLLESRIAAIEAEERARLAAPVAVGDGPGDAVQAITLRPYPESDSWPEFERPPQFELPREFEPVFAQIDGQPVTMPATAAAEPDEFGAIRVEPEPRDAGERQAAHGSEPGQLREKAAREGRARAALPPAGRRLGLLSHLAIWIVTLAAVAGTGWWFYRSGAMQGLADGALRMAERSADLSRASGPGLSGRDGTGPGEGWRDVFTASGAAQLRPGAAARVEPVAAGSGAAAVRILSASAGAEGDVALEIPADILREMAGRRSILALGLQSASAAAMQISVHCEFGALGRCPRHRFTVTQQKQETLFRVAFGPDRAVDGPGRLVINAGLNGAAHPLLLYSLRLLPEE